jgi:hypothetical protein
MAIVASYQEPAILNLESFATLRASEADHCHIPFNGESPVLRGEVISANCRYYSLSTLALACPPSRGPLGFTGTSGDIANHVDPSSTN